MNIFNNISEAISVGRLPVNSLVRSDCLEAMKYIPDKSIDLIKCDLPFNTTKCKWDIAIDLPSLWIHYKRIIKDNGAILLNAQVPFNIILGASNLPWLRYEWIWEKTSATGHLNAKKAPMKAHENILVFYNNAPTYNPQKTFGHQRKVSSSHHKRNSKKTENYGEHGLTGYDSTERYPRSVLKFKTDKQKIALHPTQKPLELEKYFINTYSNPGDTVLDNACGSGTTGVACKELGRNYILIEKDRKIFNIAKSRLL
jgi:DNA modification methylase